MSARVTGVVRRAIEANCPGIAKALVVAQEDLKFHAETRWIYSRERARRSLVCAAPASNASLPSVNLEVSKYRPAFLIYNAL